MSAGDVYGLAQGQLYFVLAFSLAVLLLRAAGCEVCVIYARRRGHCAPRRLRLSWEDWYKSYGLLISTGGLAALMRATFSPGYLKQIVSDQTGTVATNAALAVLVVIGGLGYVSTVAWWGAFRRSDGEQMRRAKLLQVIAHYFTALLVLVYGAIMSG